MHLTPPCNCRIAAGVGQIYSPRHTVIQTPTTKTLLIPDGFIDSIDLRMIDLPRCQLIFHQISVKGMAFAQTDFTCFGSDCDKIKMNIDKGIPLTRSIRIRVPHCGHCNGSNLIVGHRRPHRGSRSLQSLFTQIYCATPT